MLPFLIKIKNLLLDILFPPLCLNCQKHLENRNELICEQCLSLIKLNNTLFCPVCRARLAENKLLCRHSAKENPAFPYLLAAAGNYDEPVLQNLIHYFKYKSFENLAPILGEIILKYLDNLFKNSNNNGGIVDYTKLEIRNFIVVPIPLHKRRERERGFNQAKLLAGIIAKKFNLELKDCLKRIKNTKPQSQLKDGEKRQSNVFNCFLIAGSDFIKGKKIILVDDVFTSGSTINEAIKILKANGAKRIIALVVAKA
jgi:ComF family protein